MSATTKTIYLIEYTFLDEGLSFEIEIGFTDKHLALGIKNLIMPYQSTDYSSKIILNKSLDINKYASNDSIARIILANNQSENDDTENMAYLNYYNSERFKILSIASPEWLVFNLKELNVDYYTEIYSDITLEDN
jgi:hypothetical protein